MQIRSTPSARVLACSIVALAAASAQGQVHMSGPTLVYGTNNAGLNFFPGSGTSVGATLGTSAFTSAFRGDVLASMTGGNAAGVVYNASTTQGAYTPFTVSFLPVELGETYLNAHFKLVASGGDAVAGGNDPLVVAKVTGRVYQQMGAGFNPLTDPMIPGSTFTKTYTQNGNGYQIISEAVGAGSINYVLTPGIYYILQTIDVQASYTGTGTAEPTRGLSVEWGGPTTGDGFTGLQYAFDWQTVPAPGSLGLMGLGGLVAARRRRV